MGAGLSVSDKDDLGFDSSKTSHLNYYGKSEKITWADVPGEEKETIITAYRAQYRVKYEGRKYGVLYSAHYEYLIEPMDNMHFELKSRRLLR